MQLLRQLVSATGGSRYERQRLYQGFSTASPTAPIATRVFGCSPVGMSSMSTSWLCEMVSESYFRSGAIIE